MTPARWARVKDVFAAAIACDATRRSEFLREQCGDDTELLREVLSLLDSHESAPDFLEKPPAPIESWLGDDLQTPTANIGARIGNYELVHELGRGGMGSVYLATRADQEFQKQVAIKLIRGGMASDFVIRRFRHERQILARLEHENIARLLDGGKTVDGMPYFVMEYVEGTPITEYANAKRLTVPERIEVFLKSCAAVQYAHERGIVHRDLKPRNILVKEDGAPKLLDFGIAKLLDPDTAEETVETTLMGLRLMTPAYASPEQLRGEPATKVSDVFSLGILLYELLCSRRPDRQGTTGSDTRPTSTEKPSEAVRRTVTVERSGKESSLTLERVSEERCAAPEALVAELAGLDAIALKAIRLEPENRYASVAELIADLRHYLAGEPVDARLPSPSATPGQALPPAKSRTSIAVLPFQMLAVGADTDEYLGLALADAVITKLSNIRRIAVRSTRSVMKCAHASDPIAAGLELGVDFVLDGRLHKARDRLRITVQLVNVRERAPVWAGQFDELFEDMLKLEDSLSGQVARALVPHLSNDEQRQLEKRRTASPKAYQAYLKGRWHWSTHTQSAMARALVSFMEAIAEDENYASAHAGVADYYIWLGAWGGLPASESFAAAKEEATRALEIDPSLPEAHAALGFALWAADNDVARAEREFQLAIALNPECTNAHHWLGLLYSSMGRRGPAVLSIERARASDPFSAAVVASLALCLYNSREFDRSLEVARASDTGLGDSALLYERMAWSELAIRQHDKALASARKAVDVSERSHGSLTVLAHAMVASGNQAGAEPILEELLRRAKDSYVPPYFLALVYLSLGRRKECLDALERGVRDRDWWSTWAGVEPVFDPIRSDARFPRGAAPAKSGESPKAPTKPRTQPWKIVAVAVAIGLAVLLGIWLPSLLRPAPSPFERVRTTKLTTNGTATHAAISSDGRLVVYSISEDGRQALWLTQTNAPGRVRVAPPLDAEVGSLTLSADGAYVSFVEFQRNSPEQGELYQIPVLGGPPRRILEGVPAATSLSPDSNWIALLRWSPEHNRDELQIRAADGSSYRMLAFRAHPERFTWTAPPAWSGDGKKIAAAIEGSDSRGFYIYLQVMDVADGSRRVLDSLRWQYIEQMAWLADGRGLMVIGQEAESSFAQVWYVPLSKGEPRRIGADLSDYAGVSIAANEQALVSVQKQTLANVYTLRRNDPGTGVQVTPGVGRYFDLSWGPRGKIAYASDASGSADLWVMNADGSGQRQVTSGIGRNYAPSFSPDGEQIVFHSNRGGNWNIWRLQLERGSVTALTSGPRDSNWPQVTPDGKWVIYHHTAPDGKWNLWKIPLSGGTPVQLTTALTTHPAISPKDGRIAAWYGENPAKPQWKLAVFPPEGGAPSKTYELGPTAEPDSFLRWTPEGDGITYVDNRNGVANLWVQPVAGGPPKPLTSFPSGRIFSFDWSSDARLVVSRGMSTSDVVLLRPAGK